MIIEYHPDSKEQLLSFIEARWNELEKEHPFRYKVVEDEIGMFYMICNTFLIIVLYVSLLIITIASLGMLGMVAFTVRNREKEISIRKVMGASVKKISWILSKDFAYVIMISMAIAIPVVYLLATEIKALVPDSVGFDPLSIFIGLLITLLIAGLTIVMQAHKAARANPADVMRYE
jgi:ABC-type antimicrobial peptide transport system permease subunit